MENIYVQFDGMVYQQIVGIPMGTNCAPLIADLFLYCYERDFMSDLQKSKRHDLIDMFNDTSRYLDDIFTIDNPEFEKYIPDIYPAELQLNKANTSDKETSFLDLNIKVIGSDIHTSVYDKRDDFGFPIVNFPWLSGDVPRLPSYGIYISQLVRFARCTSVLDFHSKNLQITSKLLTQGYIYHKLRKTFGKFFRSYSELLSKFGDISFQEYGSVPVDFLRPKFRVAHTKHDVISILMNKYTYINMYIIKKIMSCIFILCWHITALLKLKWKFAGYV